ncbi:MAG TPA: polyprenol monophosphomannose synthase [Ignavibacteriales bacterium]|nr:polyprenol monophosphomannose synthase [Ignavibacteriales bacterium]HOL80478.1 polyprenol monophosphomannose synthase [Ignavibacteriales bacterium]HOM64929.1 polyprenol monophosphomannose synthase [Ignavibacteriales bacterium]HPD67950.1 polyprenol monophosphomannose synthase [Ignavibacteriales bacterium]HPP32668.1 polyprenol monophosphomannose synthase [Ignavibacteriales bacterium]
MDKKVLIIIPTYNEIENIKKMIDYLRDNYPFADILIVDDNSPDGTGEYVEKLTEYDNNIKLIKRAGKLGLGTAYVEGFKFAIQNKYDYIFEMDADFSHDPAEIKNFLKAIENADLVLGSRYITGVNVINWPMKRLLLSYFANFYTRIITGMPVKDATGGFKCFRREVLEAIDLSKIKSNGYSFQIEMTFKAWVKGFRIVEIPIIFVDRVQGVSKMSKKIVHEAIFMVWKLRLQKIFGKI